MTSTLLKPAQAKEVVELVRTPYTLCKPANLIGLTRRATTPMLYSNILQCRHGSGSLVQILYFGTMYFCLFFFSLFLNIQYLNAFFQTDRTSCALTHIQHTHTHQNEQILHQFLLDAKCNSDASQKTLFKGGLHFPHQVLRFLT